jgi:DNA-binding transcriptional ArsR family regulator
VNAELLPASLPDVSVAALSRVGSLLSNPTRSAILVDLMDGRAWTVTELARHAKVAVPTASGHLSKLLDANFVAVEAQGRHRYFRLASVELAGLLESLGGVDLQALTEGPDTKAPATLRYVRSCYDHLAGQLGVEMYQQMLVEHHLILDGDVLSISSSGERLFAGLGMDLAILRQGSRPLVRACLDWTERRHHLAGGLGAALFRTLLDLRWVSRGRRPRSLVVTAAGRDRLEQLIGKPLA